MVGREKEEVLPSVVYTNLSFCHVFKLVPLACHHELLRYHLQRK